MQKVGLVCVVAALCLTEILGMSEEMQELIDNLHNTCVGETGASNDMITAARNGDFADDENFKCYFKCLFDQMGCMTDDGKVDLEAVIALLPPEIQDKASSVIMTCTGVGANPCETAWLSHKCFQKGAPDVKMVLFKIFLVLNFHFQIYFLP
ncbi:hypothetical protein Zmor_013163 [Zophobas morio]|uniref:Uncharacterized protein n=1 Tax=Zophobas morio TaxID=2755281 RepID=A0AA38ICP5_9CUCU|nr:hypothetical protein Zmor_013163 [Zophobas morio]